MLHLNSSGQACECLQQEWSILNNEGIEMGHCGGGGGGSQVLHFIEVNVSVMSVNLGSIVKSVTSVFRDFDLL